MFTQPYPNLFKPLKIRNMTVKNRIMSAPNMLFHTVDGRPTDFYIAYLEHKARGGAGIVNLGEVCARDGGNHTPWTKPILDNMPLFGEMAAAIHEHGAAASVELTHGGERIKPQYNSTDRFLGPVDTIGVNGAKINAMTERDMEDVANSFADTTEYFLTAGFDTVLLHFAHSWLFAQFFSPIRNTRTDQYGGSFENRMRFPLMVVERVRERVGKEPPLLIRLSGSERREDGFGVDDMIHFLEKAQDYVDMAEISSEDTLYTFATTYMPYGQNADLAEAVKGSGKVRIPIFTIGSVMFPELAEEIISADRADGVSMSRALIADPYLPEKAAHGRADEIRPCLRCLNCTDSDNMSRHFICSVNPLIGREARLGFGGAVDLAKHRKKVLVAGGGPAGMQAAITASGRGHEVLLCEKGPALGGTLRFTDNDSLKNDLRRFKDYLARSVGDCGVTVLLNTEVSDELIEIFRPDHIIVATGSTPVAPDSLKGIGKARHVKDAYFDPGCVAGGSVVIIGGGLAGVETALHLSNIGKKVTVLEMQDDVVKDAKGVYRICLMRKIAEFGLRVVTGALCKEVKDGGVLYEKDGEELFEPGDAVLYALGMKSNDGPYFDLYAKAPSVVQAGDCKKTGKVDNAIHGGFFAAYHVGTV